MRTIRRRPLILALAALMAAEVFAEAAAVVPSGAAQVRREILAGLAWPYKAELARFYQAGDYAPVWLQQGAPTARALALIALFEGAGRDGLDPADYDASLWAARLARLKARPSEDYLAAFDLAVSACALRYFSDLGRGRANPRRRLFELKSGRRVLDLPGFLRQSVAAGGSLENAAALVEPPYPAYRRAKEALRKYSALAAQDDGEPLPEPPEPVKRGMSYPALPRLERRLTLLGDLPAGAVPAKPAGVYGSSLVKAVKRFQRRHGLRADGALDAHTVEEMNVPLSRRAAQLRLTLERWRWLPRSFERPPLFVNIPEFRLRAEDEALRWVFGMRVVVGEAAAGRRTPVFATEMRSVIFRPYWNVPLSIQKEELLAELEKAPGVLARKGYEVVDARGAAASSTAVTGDILGRLRTGELRLRQRPGPENPLGQVEFMMTDANGVYLHGTPSHELFAQTRRDFSHGCIRVEHPEKLAAWALREEPGWDERSVRAAMRGKKTFGVRLSRPIPVLILYGTALVMEDGEVRFFDDIYGQDAELERALRSRQGAP